MKRSPRQALLKLLLVGMFGALALVVTSPNEATACGACMNCDAQQPGHFTVCLPSQQIPAVFCQWDCVWNEDAGQYVMANPSCVPSSCSPNCYCWPTNPVGRFRRTPCTGYPSKLSPIWRS